MEAQCRKEYVSVNVDVDEEGTMHPRFIRGLTVWYLILTKSCLSATPARRRLEAVVFTTP